MAKKIWLKFWSRQSHPYIRPSRHINGCEKARLLARSPRHMLYVSFSSKKGGCLLYQNKVNLSLMLTQTLRH